MSSSTADSNHGSTSLDKWQLTPGRHWMEEIEEALREAQTIVVCIGRNGFGRVQEPEYRVALDHAWRDPRRLVIPVLLPGAPGDPKVPSFLGQRTWVDLRKGLEGDELERLMAALEGRALGPRHRGPASGDCPYPGMTAFSEKDAARFFGREKEIKDLLVRLRAGDRLLTLIGASGAGKSSLLAAGLLPAIRTGEVDGTYDWEVVRMRPGPRPIHELAVRLTQRTRGTTEELATLEAALLARTSTLSDTVDLLLADGERSTHLLLAVDQYEEIFTQAEEKDAKAFVDNLLHATTVPGGRVTAVIAMRADFLDRALDHSRALAEAVEQSQKLLLPMGPKQLRATIELPALQARLHFDDGIVDTLVHEVEGQPGDLPLLQFILQRLWRERDGARMTWEAYRRLGTLRGAITDWAENFLNALDAEEQEVVRRLFGRLVSLGEGTADTRRRASREELEGVAPDRGGELLDRLIAKRLLTAAEDGVEIIHDALIREWERLRRWIDSDRERLRTQYEVAWVAFRWDRDGRHDEDLWRGGRLLRALEMHHTETLIMTPLEQEFLQASADAERRARAQQRREIEAAYEISVATSFRMGIRLPR